MVPVAAPQAGTPTILRRVLALLVGMTLRQPIGAAVWGGEVNICPRHKLLILVQAITERAVVFLAVLFSAALEQAAGTLARPPLLAVMAASLVPVAAQAGHRMRRELQPQAVQAAQAWSVSLPTDNRQRTWVS